MMRAISAFKREWPISAAGNPALLALRMQVSMSAMGSEQLIVYLPPYQLAFTTPGIFPADASSRKQIRHN